MTAKHETSSMFLQLEHMIDDELERIAAKELVNDEELGEISTKTIREFQNDAPLDLARQLKKRSASMLRNRRRLERGFQKRNFKRWKPAFDQIEIVWHASQELGSEFNNEFRTDAHSENDFVFEALIKLHGRGLLVAKEAIHLLKGGFPDGALSRWRTLHEIFVTGMFITKHGQEIAERYLANSEFTRFSAAVQLNEYADRANLSKFSPKELEDLKSRRDSFEGTYGKEMRKAYGWARPAFHNLKDTKRITFMDIEEDTGLDHWRPRFKWASQHTHAGNRDFGSLLAESESDKHQIIVGESNSGFVDPLQMTALHISSLTTILLLLRPNIDTLVMTQAINLLAQDVAEIAMTTEQSTFDEAQGRKTRKRFWTSLKS